MPKMIAMASRLSAKNDHQWSVNDICSRILHNQTAVQRRQATIEVVAPCMGKNGIDDIATTFRKWAPTECELYLFLHLR